MKSVGSHMDDLLVMRSTKRVLSVGNDPELLWLRHAVLKHAGFDLQTVANRQVAPPYFGDVVVYGLDGPEALIEAIQGAFPERELNIQGLALNQPKHRNQAENE